LCRDNIPTVHLKTWSIKSSTFDGDKAAGLVPTLFAADPDAIVAVLDKSWIGLQHDVIKINKAIFMPEGIQIRDAAGLLKKPRYNSNSHYTRCYIYFGYISSIK